LTGVYSVGVVGSVATNANAVIDLTGVRARVRLNKQNVWGLIDTAQTPNWTEVIAA